MTVIQRIVDNRAFLFGLDYLYREAIKPHERDELLNCARNVAATLGVAPANVPIEGYYSEDQQLTEYFRLMRGLALEKASRASEVDQLAGFKRLEAVKSSPIFGGQKKEGGNSLLPPMEDPLSKALKGTAPAWNLEDVTEAAHSIVSNSDDFSLVGLASLVRDTVVLCSLGESVILYQEYFDIPAFLRRGEKPEPPTYEYIWSVDDELSRRAMSFVETFNTLFDEHLPLPKQAQAMHFWQASQSNNVVGRCVNLGYDPRITPTRYYHWAIFQNDNGIAEVQEFWSPRIWATSEYQKLTTGGGRLRESLTSLTESEFKTRR